MNQWIKCISTQANIRAVAIQATELAQFITDLHQLEAPFSARFSEAIIGGMLAAAFCDQDQKINLNIRANGQINQALVDAYPNGTVRGYITKNSSKTSYNETLGPWGEGLIALLRSQNGKGREPYIGTVPLLTGHLAKDLSFYWLQSEQVPSALGIFVQAEKNKILVASGFLIQALPQSSSVNESDIVQNENRDKELDIIEKHIQEIYKFKKEVSSIDTPLNLLTQIFQSTSFIITEEKELKFECHCSKEKIEKALLLVGKEEIKKMIHEDQGANIQCDFCLKDYSFNEHALEKLICENESL